MNKYRTHNCNELREKDVGNEIILSGWVNKKRDHGNLLFIDLRDTYGVTQCIIDQGNSKFSQLEKIQLTWQLIWVAMVASITYAGQKRKKDLKKIIHCTEFPPRHSEADAVTWITKNKYCAGWTRPSPHWGKLK